MLSASSRKAPSGKKPDSPILPMSVIDEILSRPEFKQSPPVVIDIGASGGLNPAWRPIRQYSICIAFDGDHQGIEDVPRASTSFYKQLHVFNLLVTPEPPGSAEFYITKSGTCSSMLPPNREELSDWAFANRFEVVEKRSVKTTNLPTILRELGLVRVDWFKTDSQGTDLRLLASLGDSILDRVLVAELEPGIFDAYCGEDKLWQVMSFMDQRNFWMSDIRIKGSSHIRKDLLSGFTEFEKQTVGLFLKQSPGWGEVSYINTFRDPGFTSRDFLLGWVFASIMKQHGFALHIAATGLERFSDLVFEDLRTRSLSAIKWSYLKPAAHLDLMKKLGNKLRRRS